MGVQLKQDKISRELQHLTESQIEDKLLADKSNKQYYYVIEGEEFGPLITSLMGILLSLNLNGDINLANNQYILQLAKIIEPSETELFQEVNETIIKIVNK